MSDAPVELRRGEFVVSTDRARIDPDEVLVLLRTTHAYWTDVVIAEPHRGRGLGRWLSECMLAHPALQRLRRVALITRDAADLYTGVGFTVGAGSLIYMERRP